MAWMMFEWPAVAAKKEETLTRNGMIPIGVILQHADGRRCTLDKWGRVQWWNTDKAGAMSPISTLLPCPFCGGTPVIEDCRTIWAVRCACGVCMLGERAPEPEREMGDEYWNRIRQTAIDAWNRRTN